MMGRLRIVLFVFLFLAWNADLINGSLAMWLALASYLMTGGQYTLYLVWHTAARDMRYVCQTFPLLVSST